MTKRKTDKTGRSKDAGAQHWYLYAWFVNCAAWRSLSPDSRALYLEIRCRYNGRNNGRIPMSHREAETLINRSNKPVAAAFVELQDKGFIRAITKGSFDWKVNHEAGEAGRSTRWLITEEKADYPVPSIVPGKDFMKWRPPENKTRYAEGTPMVGQGHTINDGMVCHEHTMSPRMYANGTR